MGCLLYVGPSLYGIDKKFLTNEIIIHPPVKRGDLESMIDQEIVTKNVAIVDGYFSEELAVGHKEILMLLNRGFDVWGLSSMGAIRALEMENLGLKGYGKTFNKMKNENLEDDEVCLLHMPPPTYLPVSEPLIHQRLFLTHMVKIGLINQKNEISIIHKLKRQWFGYRDLNYLKEKIKEVSLKSSYPQIETEIKQFDRFRIKNQDLETFIKNKVWTVQ